MKGKTITEAELGRRLTRDIQVAAQRRGKDPKAAVAAYVEAHNKRHKVVALDENAPEGRREIIAEELNQRIINRLTPNGRRVAGVLMRLPAAERAQIINAFSQDGSLKNPFREVK